MGNKAFEQKLAALETLQSAADFRKALADRNNYYVSKAAAMVAARSLSELIPDLLAAFDRFLIDPIKTDPQCWAKNAIVKAAKDLGLDDASFYLRGLKHIQPGCRGYVSAFGCNAANLRGICAFASDAMLHPKSRSDAAPGGSTGRRQGKDRPH